MKKYLVIGNPISHSLSPKLHNYWFSRANVQATYEKKELKFDQLESIISDLKDEKINGINVTVPFKKNVISFIDELSSEAKASQSVNTIYKEDGKIFGHNTDIAGFELGLRHINFDIKNKRVLITGNTGFKGTWLTLTLHLFGAKVIGYADKLPKKNSVIDSIWMQNNITQYRKKIEEDCVS